MTKQIIAWDLGATKCTIGLVEYHSQSHALICKKNFTVKLKDSTSLSDLVDQLEAGLAFNMHHADAICIGAAGHYNGQELVLEGIYPYPMCIAKLANKRQWPTYTVVHDYAPIVCATFTSYMEQPKNIKRLNTCKMKSHGRRVALGIGTGLGLKDGVLLDNGDFWLGRNEIGHIGIVTPPTAEKHHTDLHLELIKYLQQQHLVEDKYPVTFEKILSGQGTVRLHNFFYPHEQEATPESVGKRMREGKAPEMCDAFAWYLGLLVGTVQLSFMPEGGMWITGGVSINHMEIFDHPAFFAGIHASPAYIAQRQEYPLGVLCNLEHAIIGSGYYAAKRLLNYSS